MTQLGTHVSLAHGNGGRFMRELINELFARYLANPYLDTGTDAAVLPWDARDGQLVFTTDSFTVQPIEFPGGNIGTLAVHGTTNDLAVAGAKPKYLSLGVLLEEGLEIAVLLAREQFGLRGDLQSDAASVLPITRELVKFPGLRFMRDPTRGGLATVAHEIVQGSGLGIALAEAQVPVRDSVRSVCEMLGYDPYFLACEGRVVAVVAQDDAGRALRALQALPSGRDAAIIGLVQPQPARVLLETTIGGERVIEELEDDPLPRIC